MSLKHGLCLWLALGCLPSVGCVGVPIAFGGPRRKAPVAAEKPLEKTAEEDREDRDLADLEKVLNAYSD